MRVLEKNSAGTSRITQLDFESFEELHAPDAPSELLEKLRQVDPETLTPLEGLKLVYELKEALDNH